MVPKQTLTKFFCKESVARCGIPSTTMVTDIPCCPFHLVSWAVWSKLAHFYRFFTNLWLLRAVVCLWDARHFQ